jgi:hypothetical protein
MGQAAALNNLGGILSILVAGLLLTINWRYIFLLYCLPLVVLIAVCLYLPEGNIAKISGYLSFHELKKMALSLVSIFLVMLILYAFPSNFAIVNKYKQIVPDHYLGAVMMLANIAAFLTGICLPSIRKIFARWDILLGPPLLMMGFFCLTIDKGPIIIAGIIMIGIGVGILIPLLNINIVNTIPKNKTPVAMSIAGGLLYLGQFASPLVIDSVHQLVFDQSPTAPFLAAVMISSLLMVTVIFSR